MSHVPQKPIDQEKLAKQGAARKHAIQYVELMDADWCLMVDEAQHAFVDQVREWCGAKETQLEGLLGKPGVPPSGPRPAITPMSDSEAWQYGALEFTYGKWEGDTHENQLAYLDWLAGEKRAELRQMERYLLNDKVAQRLREELESRGE